nr:MAG TPA: hypothetical protein [Caudoviricetes sp.]
MYMTPFNRRSLSVGTNFICFTLLFLSLNNLFQVLFLYKML